jgi:hypothetical protein
MSNTSPFNIRLFDILLFIQGSIMSRAKTAREDASPVESIGMLF